MKCRLVLCLMVIQTSLFAQSVAINTTGSSPDSSAMLDVQSNSKGILIPKMTITEREAIVSPANGLMIYQTNFNPGFYYNAGTPLTPIWIKVGSENTGKGSYIYQAGGTYTLTVPNGVTVMEFEATSGGGGGGGGQIFNSSFCGVGDGGGGAGFCSGMLKVNPGDGISIVVGAGGTAGITNTTPTPGSNGGNGGNTTISVNGILVLTITGGQGGAGGVCTGSVMKKPGIGGDGGVMNFYNGGYITPYVYPGGRYAQTGGSMGLPTGGPDWGTGGYPVCLGQFNTFVIAPNALTFNSATANYPHYGAGGFGGTNASNGFGGISGYVVIRY
jgi:hypothetical protein